MRRSARARCPTQLTRNVCAYVATHTTRALTRKARTIQSRAATSPVVIPLSIAALASGAGASAAAVPATSASAMSATRPR